MFEEQHANLLQKGHRRVSPFFIPMMISDMAAGQVSIQFGLKGPNYGTVSACASGAHAIGDAAAEILRPQPAARWMAACSVSGVISHCSTTISAEAIRSRSEKLAAEAAAIVEANGISVEVLDLRTLIPWDREAVLESARRTSKVLVLHEDTRTGGFGAEIAATIAEEAFEHLDGPVKRIAAPDAPVPFSPPLERAYIPQVDDVVAGLRELAAY